MSTPLCPGIQRQLQSTGAVSTAANDGIRIKFFGRTAHAGVEPWQGRSALKAAELFGIGIQFMREHVEPTVRMHYVYEKAGLSPNIVPDFAHAPPSGRIIARTW